MKQIKVYLALAFIFVICFGSNSFAEDCSVALDTSVKSIDRINYNDYENAAYSLKSLYSQTQSLSTDRYQWLKKQLKSVKASELHFANRLTYWRTVYAAKKDGFSRILTADEIGFIEENVSGFLDKARAYYINKNYLHEGQKFYSIEQSYRGYSYPDWVNESSSVSESLKRLGLKTITHGTSFESLVKIINSKKISRQPYVSAFGTSNAAPGVYTQLELDSLESKKFGPIQIEIDVSLLEIREDYRLNPFYIDAYGNVEGQTLFANTPLRITEWAYAVVNRLGSEDPGLSEHELVFFDDIPLASIKRVRLPERYKKQIEQLNLGTIQITFY